MRSVDIIRNDLHEQDDDEVLYPSTFEKSNSCELKNRIDEYYRKTFGLLSFFGLHIFHIRPNGEVTMCYLRLFARCVALTVTIIASCETLFMKIYFMWPMWFLIMTLPFWYAAIYSVTVYLSLFSSHQSHRMFMEQMVKLSMQGTYNITLKIFWLFVYIGIFMATVCFVIPSQWWVVLSPIFASMLIPTLLDIYMSLFGQAITECIVDLTGRITQMEEVTLEDMNTITADYMFIRNILDLFNEVYSPIKTYRIFLFGMQSTGLLYTLSSFEDPKECLEKFIPFALALVESIVRFYMICERADYLGNRGRLLHRAIDEKLLLTPRKEDEIASRLKAIAGRLKTQPLVALARGFGTMDTKTIVSTGTLILTYLLLLISLQPALENTSLQSEQLAEETGFGQCLTFEAQNLSTPAVYLSQLFNR